MKKRLMAGFLALLLVFGLASAIPGASAGLIVRAVYAEPTDLKLYTDYADMDSKSETGIIIKKYDVPIYQIDIGSGVDAYFLRVRDLCAGLGMGLEWHTENPNALYIYRYDPLSLSGWEPSGLATERKIAVPAQAQIYVDDVKWEGVLHLMTIDNEIYIASEEAGKMLDVDTRVETVSLNEVAFSAVTPYEGAWQDQRTNEYFFNLFIERCDTLYPDYWNYAEMAPLKDGYCSYVKTEISEIQRVCFNAMVARMLESGDDDGYNRMFYEKLEYAYSVDPEDVSDILETMNTYSTDREKVTYLAKKVCDQMTYYSVEEGYTYLAGYNSLPQSQRGPAAVTVNAAGGSIWQDRSKVYTGVCRHYTGVFAGLLQAAGYTQGQVSPPLHVLNTVWLPDEGKWVAVDCTWADGAQMYQEGGDDLGGTKQYKEKNFCMELYFSELHNSDSNYRSGMIFNQNCLYLAYPLVYKLRREGNLEEELSTLKRLEQDHLDAIAAQKATTRAYVAPTVLEPIEKKDVLMTCPTSYGWQITRDWTNSGFTMGDNHQGFTVNLKGQYNYMEFTVQAVGYWYTRVKTDSVRILADGKELCTIQIKYLNEDTFCALNVTGVQKLTFQNANEKGCSPHLSVTRMKVY